MKTSRWMVGSQNGLNVFLFYEPTKRLVKMKLSYPTGQHRFVRVETNWFCGDDLHGRGCNPCKDRRVSLGSAGNKAKNNANNV